MSGGVWVTAGAPRTDGWRVWYSWPGGEFTPQLPRVRTPAGVQLEVTAKDWKPAPPLPGSERRMAVREIEVRGAKPGELYEVTVPELGTPQFWRTLPTALGNGVSLLMGSCFWLDDDKEGHYSAAMRELIQRERPAFKVLMGDQLYVDVWYKDYDDIRGGLARKYESYWGDAAYRGLLSACPTLVSCDDHEFWNDFPERQVHVPLSWNDNFAESSQALAQLYDAYQSALNPDAKRWFSFDIDPISFFVADTRSHRSRQNDDDQALMTEPQWLALEQWGKELKGPGVIVLPQPLLKAGGSPTDRTLVDFRECSRLGAVFEQATGRDHDVLILTGDIHTGRLSVARIESRLGRVFEFVASPASLVTPYLSLWDRKPSKLPDKLTINGKRWSIETYAASHTTIDNNIGLIKIEPGRAGSYRFSLQLWRIRPSPGLVGRLLKGKPASKGAQPMHDPIELELR